MGGLTPDTCRYPDLFCTECQDRDSCGPLADELRKPVFGGHVEVRRKRALPRWLKDASLSVRKSYGY